MNLHHMESFVNAIKNYSYSQAMAFGSLSGFLTEFINSRGSDVVFVFVAGVVGALGGGLVKWSIDYFLPKKPDNDTPHKD